MEKEFVSGNAVYAVDKKNPSKRIPAKISTRTQIGIEYYAPQSNALKNMEIEPVKITADILINNGFRHTNDFPERYYFPTGTTTYFVKLDKEEGNFYIGMEDSGNDRRVSIPLMYLHDLQNAAYYIRGKEIDFKNY